MILKAFIIVVGLTSNVQLQEGMKEVSVWLNKLTSYSDSSFDSAPKSMKSHHQDRYSIENQPRFDAMEHKKSKRQVPIEEDEEEEFVSIYGNDVNTSGIWEAVREFRDDKEKLANISLQVHMAANLGNETDRIKTVVFDTQTYFMTKNPPFKDVQLDLVKYSVKRTPNKYVYFGKGMRPGCVHLLIHADEPRTLFFLGQHICDIIL